MKQTEKQLQKPGHVHIIYIYMYIYIYIYIYWTSRAPSISPAWKSKSAVLKNQNMCDVCDVLHHNKYKNVVLHLHVHAQNTRKKLAVANRLRFGAPTRSDGQGVLNS
jgi:hypothetical protein